MPHAAVCWPEGSCESRWPGSTCKVRTAKVEGDPDPDARDSGGPKCAEKLQQCASSSCCAQDGMTCYEKGPGFALCLPTGTCREKWDAAQGTCTDLSLGPDGNPPSAAVSYTWEIVLVAFCVAIVVLLKYARKHRKAAEKAAARKGPEGVDLHHQPEVEDHTIIG